MSPAARSRLQAFLRTTFTYLFAVALPLLASWLTDRFLSLHAIPFALYFIVIVVMASLGGVRAMLLALVVAALSRNYLDPWTVRSAAL